MLLLPQRSLRAIDVRQVLQRNEFRDWLRLCSLCFQSQVCSSHLFISWGQIQEANFNLKRKICIMLMFLRPTATNNCSSYPVEHKSSLTPSLHITFWVSHLCDTRRCSCSSLLTIISLKKLPLKRFVIINSINPLEILSICVSKDILNKCCTKKRFSPANSRQPLHLALQTWGRAGKALPRSTSAP